MVCYCLVDCETKHCTRVEEGTGSEDSGYTGRVLWQDGESKPELGESVKDSAVEFEEMLLMRRRCVWRSIAFVLAQAMVG